MDKLELTRIRLDKANEMFYCNIGPKEPKLLFELLMPNHPLRNQLLEFLSDTDLMALSCVCRTMPRVYPEVFGRRIYFTISNSGDIFHQPRQIDKSFSLLPNYHLVDECEFISKHPFPTRSYKYKQSPKRDPWGIKFTIQVPNLTQQKKRNTKLVGLEVLQKELAELHEEFSIPGDRRSLEMTNNEMTLPHWIYVLEEEINVLEAIIYKLEKNLHKGKKAKKKRK